MQCRKIFIAQQRETMSRALQTRAPQNRRNSFLETTVALSCIQQALLVGLIFAFGHPGHQSHLGER